jgi:hypothetical protein
VKQFGLGSGPQTLRLTPTVGARGEGIKPEKTFFGLDLSRHRNIVILVVEEHLSRVILEGIAEAGEFETEPGSGKFWTMCPRPGPWDSPKVSRAA